MDRFTVAAREGTGRDDEGIRPVHFYPSSIQSNSGEPMLSIATRGRGLRMVPEQVKELHEYLGEWMDACGVDS